MHPDLVGRFQLQNKIGGNERGAVYEAVDTDNNRLVAVKLLDARSLYTMTIQKKFAQQMAALKAVKHPSILPLIDFGAEDNHPFIVMPLMSGNLEQKIGAEPITVDEVLDLAGKIGSGLDFAAANNVFHFEIKPSNILFDEHGHPLIADLGLIQVINSLSAANKSTANPYYMSPEQVRRRPLTARSHVYSLGTLLFHVLTGQVLFTGATDLVAGFKHTSESPRKIRTLRPDLGKSFDLVIDRALEKKPEERFPDCSTFTRMLTSAHGGMITPEEVREYEEPNERNERVQRDQHFQTRPKSRPQTPGFSTLNPKQLQELQQRLSTNQTGNERKGKSRSSNLITLLFVAFWLCITLASCIEQLF